MTAGVAVLVGSLVLAAVVYDIARLVTRVKAVVRRWPGSGAAVPDWRALKCGSPDCGCTTIDATAYRTRISLALGERTPRRT